MGIRTGWQGLFCLEVWGQNRVILTRVTFHSTARVTTFLRCGLTFFSSVKFSPSVVFDSLWPHGLQHIRLPCPSPTPSPTPGACSNSCSSSVMPSNHLTQRQQVFHVPTLLCVLFPLPGSYTLFTLLMMNLSSSFKPLFNFKLFGKVIRHIPLVYSLELLTVLPQVSNHITCYVLWAVIPM